MNTVDFQIVKLYRNNSFHYTEFSLEPLSKKATEVYAIRIGNDTFLLGDKGNGLHIAEENYVKDKV